MRAKGDKKVKIPEFSNEEEASEWYEQHEVTDHLEDTEEVKPDNVFYQDSKGLWYRSSDGMQVSAPLIESQVFQRYRMNEQVRLIHEAPIREVFLYVCEQMREDAEPFIRVEKGDEVTWTSTSLSYVTTQKQDKRLTPSA